MADATLKEKLIAAAKTTAGKIIIVIIIMMIFGGAISGGCYIKGCVDGQKKAEEKK